MNNLNSKPKITVYYDVLEKNYSVCIRVNKKRYYLGCSPDKFEAICACKSARNVIKNFDFTDMSDSQVRLILTGDLI